MSGERPQDRSLQIPRLSRRFLLTALLAGGGWTLIECSSLQLRSALWFSYAYQTPLFWLAHLSIGVSACCLISLVLGVVQRPFTIWARRFSSHPETARAIGNGLAIFALQGATWTAAWLTTFPAGALRRSTFVAGLVIGALVALLFRRYLRRQRPALNWVKSAAFFAVVLLVHAFNHGWHSKNYFTVHVAATLCALIASVLGARYALRGLRRPTGPLLPRWATPVLLAALLLVPSRLFWLSNDVRHALFSHAFDAKAVLYMGRKIAYGRTEDGVSVPTGPAISSARSAGVRRVDRVLLITVDTLRADHLPMYGYHRNTAPALQAFSQGAATFKEVWASGASTNVALNAIFADGSSRSTLGPALAQAGIDRLAVISERMFRFQRQDWLGSTFTRTRTSPGDADALVGKAAEQEITEGRFSGFMWIHLLSPHHPYEPWGVGFGSGPLNRYDGEILHADGVIKGVLAALDRKGLRQRTAVIISSDHGEEFGEHGGATHGWDIHNELLRIPLLIDLPGDEAREIAMPVVHHDIAPTIADLLGTSAPSRSGGMSLVPLLSGEAGSPARPVQIGPVGTFKSGAVICGPWKLAYSLYNGSYALFDMGDDPGERRNLFEVEPVVASRLIGLIDRSLGYSGGRPGGSQVPDHCAPSSGPRGTAAKGAAGGS